MKSSYELKKTNSQTTCLMELDYGKEDSPKNTLAECRILLKTIPNKIWMKNKYKTKLKKICITWHQLFSGWQYLLMKTRQLSTFYSQTKSWGS